jgi:hypothetical protein
MAPALILESVRVRMRARTWWIRMVKANHATHYDHIMPSKGSIRDVVVDVIGQITAGWNATTNEDRDPNLTELTIKHHKETDHVKWTSWMASPPEPVQNPIHFNLGIMGGDMPFGGEYLNFAV